MKALLFLTLFLTTVIVFGQSNYEDVVYLKNGSVIHGMIIEQISNVSIKIKTSYNNVFAYKIEEVEKFTKEEINKKAFKYDSLAIKTTYTTDIGGIFGFPHTYDVAKNGNNFLSHNNAQRGGAEKYKLSEFELRIMIDKMINKHLSLGGGLNIDPSSSDAVTADPTVSSVMIPVYFNVKYAFLPGRVSPFFSGQAGATFYSGDFIGGGAMAALSWGLKVYIARNTAINLSLGYRFQHIAYKGYIYDNNAGVLTYTPTSTMLNSLMHYIDFHVGFTF
jgi:hypothetical protein